MTPVKIGVVLLFKKATRRMTEKYVRDSSFIIAFVHRHNNHGNNAKRKKNTCNKSL